MLKDKIDYFVTTIADYERLNDIDMGDRWVNKCIKGCEACPGWDYEYEIYEYCENVPI